MNNDQVHSNQNSAYSLLPISPLPPPHLAPIWPSVAPQVRHLVYFCLDLRGPHHLHDRQLQQLPPPPPARLAPGRRGGERGVCRSAKRGVWGEEWRLNLIPRAEIQHMAPRA